MSNQDFIIVDGLLEKYIGNNTVVIIPEGITAIGKNAFYYDVDKDNKTPLSDIIEKIIIPDGVVSIGESAFNRCKKLKEINIPDSVISIDDYAFSHCESLKEIFIPDSVKTIGGYVFSYCYSLEKVKLPKGIKEIPNHMFCNCRSLTEFVIPNSVKKIGWDAFCSTSLKEVNIPKGVKKLERGVFAGCAIEVLDIPANVTTLEDSVLSPALKRLIIRADSAKVSNELFYGKWHKQFNEVPPVEIYCTLETKAKMPKNFHPACIDIACLDSSSEYVEPEIINIYKIDDKFLADQIISENNLDDAFDRYVPPKNKIFKVKDGAEEIKVKTKFGNSIKKAKSEIEDAWRLYDMYVADEYLLSRDEVIAKIDAIDPNRRSDAFAFATPEIDNEKAPRLGRDSAKRRFLIMAHIAEKLLDDKIIKKLVDEMPRKKDGTFAKNKILRIASSRIVQFPCDILEIFAKADTDTSFAVTAEFRKFSSEEVALLEFDFISRNSNILGLKFE
ncbi:MAG: leucine-rich repeat domain-containing protein [Acutalibacteraceae bacterium]|nr:leucine-rich repeat domain-containing protein [Acutalibacteraceae bacterium]